MQLTSTKNPLLQSIRRAVAAGRPTENGLIVAEGPHLVEEAVRSEWRIVQVFATSIARNRHAELLSQIDAELIEVSARAFASLAATESTQELLALLEPRRWSWEDLAAGHALIVVLDGIQDPGNAGAIVRSAEAFGATGAVLLEHCARVANPKFLRATAGSIFRLPFLEGLAVEALTTLRQHSKLQMYALSAGAPLPVTEADFRSSCLLAVGSEGHGVSPELLSQARAISISTSKVESLNAAVACSIALFEAQRQRNAP
jgi:TrmH family RNA methyltransferase